MAGLGIDILGLGICTSLGIKYSYDLYDFFNNNFSPDGIIKPYDGFHNKSGYISFKILTYIRLN